MALVVLIAFDQWNSYKHEKPPKPFISVGDTNLKYAFASYSWHGTVKKSKELSQAVYDIPVPTPKVNPFQQLHVKFPKKPDKVRIEVWNTQTNEKVNSKKGLSIDVPNFPWSFVFVIKAEWGKENATYITRINIGQKVSYQQFLPWGKRKYTVLELLPGNSPDSTITKLPHNLAMKLDKMSSWGGTLEDLKKQQPDLPITEVPAYFVFDQKKIIFETNNLNQLIEFLKKKLKPLK
ncbi:hypothetical protein [Neobacillus terrae]|uniref:hypothetical protein n=1 Tax=Neobacillus terrae TaxID=3034837 RepID=UPI00140D3966|nr:hypothetical protein [Neobacillus terrae]NHM32236.1 hypothetical protein [Neobacillus terrae]